MTASWIEGNFEGVYAGQRVRPAKGPRSERRFTFELQSGKVTELQLVSAPTEPSDDEVPPNEIRQDRLDAVVLVSESGELGARECALFDLRVVDFELSDPAEGNGRAYGTVAGRVRARLAPDDEAPSDTDSTTLQPPTVGRHGREVHGEAPDVAYARARFALALLALGCVSLALALSCGARTAVIYASPLVGAILLRRLTKPSADSQALSWGVVVVGLQLLVVATRAIAAGGLPCAPSSVDLALIGAPVLIAGLVRARWALVACAFVWTALSCAVCAGVPGSCAGEITAPYGKPAAHSQTGMTDASGMSGRAGMRSGSGADVGSPGLAHAAAPRTDPQGRWPATPPSLSAEPSGVMDARRVTEPTAVRGQGAANTAGEVAVAGAQQATSTNTQSQMASRASAAGPGGWVAADHRRAHRDLVRISIEHANRTPASFFESEGRHRVYLPTDSIFEPGGARIGPQGDLALARLAALLSLRPSQLVTVEVHTDAGDGSGQLSERRAAAVATWLTDRGHLQPRRIDAVGVGNMTPLVPPDGSYDAQQPNRRIEVRLGA